MTPGAWLMVAYVVLLLGGFSRALPIWAFVLGLLALILAAVWVLPPCAPAVGQPACARPPAGASGLPVGAG